MNEKVLYVLIGLVVVIVILALTGCAPKVEADAYICGEPPDEVTFYCKVGTGPPREDCSAPQTGEFDGVDPITC